MASADDNQDGILGNLPRSRPGVRSDKRDRGGTGAKKAAAKPQAAKPKPAAAAPKPRTTAAKPKQPAAPRPAAPARSSDPIEQAVHLVGEVAETGIKTLAKVAGGVLRRLPRP